MSRRLITATLLIITLAGSTAALAATLDVPAGFPDVATALAAAKSGDTVRLAPGIYYEANLSMPNGVTLEGTGKSPESVVLDAGHSGRILLCEGLATPSVIRNMTFMNGRASGSTSYDRSGGAILVNNSNVSILDCTFMVNEADSHGGAIRSTHASPYVIRCKFFGNSAGEGGGAMDISYDASPLVLGCTFRDNTAQWGGALSCRGVSAPRIEDTEFEANIAGGDLGFGGAIFTDNGSTPHIMAVTFADNRARLGGGLAGLSDATADMSYCTVATNAAEQGGAGIFLLDAAANIQNSIISFNEGAGLIATGSADPVISCTNIFGNTSGDWVGLIVDQADETGNLSADPAFYTLDRWDEMRFHLTDASPASETCGSLGANPQAMSPTTPPPGPLRGDLGDVSVWPNPFNPRTSIHFDLGEPQRVKVEIYNLQGARIRLLADDDFAEGPQSVSWNGDDASGRRVGSGIYFAIVQGRQDRETRKLTLLK